MPHAAVTHGHATEEFGYDLAIQSLLMLHIHLEATHFVGTRFSNWCRLIDELRRSAPEPASLYDYVDVVSPEPPWPPWFAMRRRRERRERERMNDFWKNW